jgi:glycosyltransferase involved in cell wall biosynthesis
MTGELWVVVPAYNEADWIGGVLSALAAQTDLDFSLVVVDNASTDGTGDLVRELAARLPFRTEVITESGPGAGTAADTGFRHAIERGAVWLARTDADCRPRPDWVATAKSVLGSGAEMACGRSVPRRDEDPSLVEARLLPAVIRMLSWYGRWRRDHRRPEFRTPYVLCHGHNLAISADLYLRCGGAVRVPLQAEPEDVALLNRARRHSERVVRAENLVVESSLRRLRAWGPRRVLLWHWDRRYVPATPAEVHVR